MRVGKKQVIGTANLQADAWELVYSSGEIAAAATSITISGLDGNTDTQYRLLSRFVNGYAGCTYGICPNNDTTVGNYGYQYLVGYSTTIAAARAANYGYARIGEGNGSVGDKCLSDTIIYAKSGYVRTMLTSEISSITGTSVGYVFLWGNEWSNTADNITSLVITADQANGLGIGTSIELYRKVARV